MLLHRSHLHDGEVRVHLPDHPLEDLERVERGAVAPPAASSAGSGGAGPLLGPLPDDHLDLPGLEREVIVLCELPEDAGRLDELLYVGLTRATTHVVVIAPPALAERLRGTG